ncbi:MAG: hypothetical protein ABI790_13530 [Betaproteobacteria bacterium]
MNKISRPLLYTLLVVLIVAIIAAVLASGPFPAGHGPALVMFDEDLSDSALGWALAIPIMVFVGIVVGAILAGAALITVIAIAFAALMVALALLLAFTPFAIFLAIPVLAVYGFVKLVRRDQQQAARVA